MNASNPEKGIGEKIIKASIVIAIAHLFLKLSGFIQARAAAHYLDDTNYSVILVTGFTGVIGSLFLIGEESIGPSFLPVFMKEKDTKGEKAAFEFTNALLTIQTLILLIIITIVICFPEFMIKIFTEWNINDDPYKYNLLRQSIVYLAPCLLFISIGSTTYMLLNGYKKFFFAAIGDATTKICLIIALIIGIGIFKWDIKVIYFGLLVGSILKVATHLCGLFTKIKLFRPNFKFNTPAMRTFLLLILPLLLGIIFAKIRDNYNNIRILTHLKDDTMIMQANDLGRKLFASISWLVPYTLQIALFPFLCELVDKDDKQKLGEVLTNSSRLMLSIFIPGSILLFVIAKPLSFVLFFGGKIELHTAFATALAMGCYFLVLPAQAVECVMMQGFFAKRKVIAVTAIGISCSLLSVLISYTCIVYLELRSVQALMAMALGFVFSRTIKSVILVFFLKRTIPMLPFKQTISFIVRLIILASIVGITTFASKKIADKILNDNLQKATTFAKKQIHNTNKIKITKKILVNNKIKIHTLYLLIKIMFASIIGGTTFIIGAWLLKIKEPFTIIMWFINKLLAPIIKIKKRIMPKTDIA